MLSGDSLFSAYDEQSEAIHILGSVPSADSLLVARLIRTIPFHLTTPTIVLCPNDDVAREFCNDIECLSQVADGVMLKALHFPTWEQSPYSTIRLSLHTRISRVACLSQIAQPGKSQLVVTTLAAACQASVSKEFFRKYSNFVKVDESIGSREQFLSRLLKGGYLRVDPVEDAGTFAVRGDIIDVFPPHLERPVRIEIFDDVVERIREFDSETQRTSSDESSQLRELHLYPAREVLINSETSDYLRQKIKSFADDIGVPRSIRDPILASIRDGIYPEHSDTWAPFAYPEHSNLWKFLPEKYSVFWIDELSCRQEWDTFLTEQKKLSENASASQKLTPRMDSLFTWSSQSDDTLKKHSRIYFDRIHLSDAESILFSSDENQNETTGTKKHDLKILSNRDLVKGSRVSLGELEKKLRQWMKKDFKIAILASTQSQQERIRFLLEETGLSCQSDGPLTPAKITVSVGAISEGFRWLNEKLIILTESEILGTPHSKKQRKLSKSESESASRDWSELHALSDLSSGDAVVHLEHGIGRYHGLVRLDLGGALSDFLLLEYANKDKLYLPVYRINTIQKYVGAAESLSLDRLGSQQFHRAKEKVKEAVKGLAIDLVQLYAERKLKEGVRFSPKDAEFREFETQFPFDETPDQLKAIESILKDLESGRTMDRLICGDVGYGKTEVAMRAAFRAVSDGKQVAVLVPTTILAQQHESSFKERMKAYPLIIESVSRFKSTKEQKSILEAAATGKVDILIGTHRLLSRDVQFQDLGLVIVDEEHRFGVEHKERLKTLKINTHFLTLTATPIPRTLHMALAGLRDISLISTPPVNRLPIRTYVSTYDDELIRQAVEFELSRGGQVFFLHNRVQSINERARKIRALVPSAEVIVAHGQMTEAELENQMRSFYQKKSNVLVCTTIIESGLDLPSANTIIIDRADSLGLAQLYQIRGRVGRGDQRAYAYLLIPSEGILTDDAKRRLEVIQRFVELGSGFSIASHDLEIRGGGDLLGPQQSGHIASVGFDLYTELLEEAIREIQGKPILPEESRREPEIKTPFPSYLSETFVPDVHQRLSLYRRLSGTRDEREIDRIEEEMLDRFGLLPAEAQNLIWIIRIKLLLKKTGMEALTVGPEKISLVSGPQSQLDPVKGIVMVTTYPDQFQLTPDSKLVVKAETKTPRDLYFGLEKLFKDFCRPNTAK
jgi:transcription-repair coupling factor (superfamily II helicase)